MAEADREIGREFATLRKVRLYPGKCAKQGCLAKWINAIRVQATIKGCADMIPAMDAEGKCRIPTVPTDDKELIEFLKRQRRLAELLHEWSCTDTEWDEYNVLDPSSNTIGTDMWMVIMRIYNGISPRAIQNQPAHKRHFSKLLSFRIWRFKLCAL